MGAITYFRILEFTGSPEIVGFCGFSSIYWKIEPLNPPFECFLNLENCRKYLFRVRLMNPQNLSTFDWPRAEFIILVKFSGIIWKTFNDGLVALKHWEYMGGTLNSCLRPFSKFKTIQKSGFDGSIFSIYWRKTIKTVNFRTSGNFENSKISDRTHLEYCASFKKRIRKIRSPGAESISTDTSLRQDLNYQ